MKFTKQGADYISGKFSIKKDRGWWATYYEGVIVNRARRLDEAKAECVANRSPGAPGELKQNALFEIAATSVEFDKAWGIPWHKWAELRIGCTAAELRALEERQDAVSLIEDVGELFNTLECVDADPEALKLLFSRLGGMVGQDSLKGWIEHLIDDYGIEIGAVKELEKEIEDLENTIEELKESHEVTR